MKLIKRMHPRWQAAVCVCAFLIGGMFGAKTLSASDLSALRPNASEPNLEIARESFGGELWVTPSETNMLGYLPWIRWMNLNWGPAASLGGGWHFGEGWLWKGALGFFISHATPRRRAWDTNTYQLDLELGGDTSRYMAGLRWQYKVIQERFFIDSDIIPTFFGGGLHGQYYGSWDGQDSYLHGGVNLDAYPFNNFLTVQLDISYRYVLSNPRGDLNQGFFLSLNFLLVFLLSGA